MRLLTYSDTRKKAHTYILCDYLNKANDNTAYFDLQVNLGLNIEQCF